jgi:hypothetical protein
MPDGNKPGDKKPTNAVDPVALRVSGVTKEQFNAEGFTVRPMTMEESWNTNKHLLEDQMNLDQFAILYRDVYQEDATNSFSSYLDEQSNKRYEWTTEMPVKIAKRMLPVKPELMGLPANYKEGEVYQTNITPGEIGMKYNNQGRREFTLTAEETAESKNKYLGMDGKYHNLGEFYIADVEGTPFKYNKDGSKTMLTLNPQSREWVEAPSDAVVSSRQIRSIWGPQAAESGIGENVAANVWNTWVDETSGAAGTVAEVFGMLPKVFGYEDGFEGLEKWGREMQNFSGGQKSKISEAVEQEGAFGSWRAGLGTAANALTQVGSQALVGAITRGATAPLQALAKGSKAAKWLHRSLNGAPWAFGAAYAMQAMNDEAKAIGASDEARAVLSLAAAGAVFTAEKLLHRMGSSGLADMFENGSLNNQMHRQIKKELGDLARKHIDESGNLMPGGKEAFIKEMKAVYQKAGINLDEPVSKSRIQAMANNAANWMRYSDKPRSFMGRLKGGIEGAYEEGMEEVIEAVVNGATKTIYNNGYADPNAEPGQGKFDNPFGELSLSTFFAGAIGGGTMGMIRGSRRKPNMKGIAIANIATQMSKEDGLAFLADMHKKGQFHSPLHTQDGQYINALPKDQQAQAKSMNDVMYQQYVAQLEQAHEIMQQTGLADPEMLTKVLGEDQALQRDALFAFTENRRLKEEKAKLQASLESDQVEKGSAEQKQLIKKIEEIDQQIAENSSFTDQVMSGKAHDKYKAIMMMRALEINKEQTKEMTVKEINALDKEGREALLDKSLAKAQETDNWSNRDKAIERFKRIQEWNAEYKKRHEEVEKVRTRSREVNKRLEAVGKVNSGESFDLMLGTMEGEAITDDDKALARTEVQERLNEMDAYVAKEMKDSVELGRNSTELQKAIDDLYDEMYKKEMETRQEQHEANGMDGTVPDLSAEEKAALRGKAKSSVEGDVEFYLNEADETDGEVGTESLESLIGKDAATRYIEAVQRRSRLGEFSSKNILDDRDKQLIRMADREGESKDKQNFSKLYDYEDPTVQEGLDFIATTSNGTKYLTSPENYIEAAKNGEEVEEGVYKYKGEVFSTEPSQEINGKRTVQIQLDGMPKLSVATRVSKAGQDFLNVAKRDKEVKLLMQDYEAAGRNPDAALEQRAKELRESLQDDVSTLELMMELAEYGLLNDNNKEWLGLDASDRQGLDLDAYYNSLLDALDSAKNLHYMISQSTDMREENFRKLQDVQAKWQGQMINELGALMPERKVMHNGTELARPAFPNPQNLTSKDLPELVKAMQYWHLYLHQYPKTEAGTSEAIKDLRIFWHQAVGNMRVDYDGQNNPIFTTESKNGKDVFFPPSASKIGMQMNDFPELLEFENFTDTSKGYKFRASVYYDFMNMIFNTDPQQVYKGLLNILDDPNLSQENAKFRGAHTSEQLMVALPILVHAAEMNRLNKIEQMAKSGGAKAVEATQEMNYYQQFKTVLKIGGDPKVPTGMFRRLLDSSNDMTFDQAVEFFQGKADKNYRKQMVADNFRLVTGSGGSGKTTFITMTSLMVALDQGFTTKDDIILVAPNEAQVNELEEALKIVGLKLDPKQVMLVDDFIDSHESENMKGKFIIMDEVSLLSMRQKARTYAVEYESLKSLSKGAKLLDRSNTVIVMGDEIQAPYDAKQDKESGAVANQMQHGMNITQVKRSNVQDVFFLQADFRRGFSRSGGNYPTTSAKKYYVAPDGKQEGVRLFDQEDEFFGNLKQRMAADEGVVLIVYNEDDVATVLEKLGEEQSSKLKERIFIMKDIKKTPQGRSWNEVYVYMPAEGGIGTLKDEVGESYEAAYYNRYMGTAVGRARKFVGLYTGDGRLKHEGSKPVTDPRDIPKFAEDKDDLYTAKKKALHDLVKSAAEVGPLSKTEQRVQETKNQKNAEKEEKEDTADPVGETVTDEVVVEETNDQIIDDQIAKLEKSRAEELKNSIRYGDLSATGDLSVRTQGFKDMRDDLLALEKAGKILPVEVKKVMAFLKASLKTGKSLEQISNEVFDRFGIKVSGGKWVFAEREINEINAKYDNLINDLLQKQTQPKNNTTETTTTDSDGVVVDETEEIEPKKKKSLEDKNQDVLTMLKSQAIVTFTDGTGKEYKNVVVSNVRLVGNDAVNPQWHMYFTHDGEIKLAIVEHDGRTIKIVEVQTIENKDDNLPDNQEPTPDFVAEEEVTYETLDNKDGGSVTIDPDVSETDTDLITEGYWRSAKHDNVFKVGATVSFIFKGEVRTRKITKIEVVNGETKIFTGRKGWNAEAFAKMAADYVAAASTKEADSVKSDIIRLLQFNKLSVLNHYTDNPDFRQGHLDMKRNMNEALKKASVRLKITAKKGGFYYDRKGNELPAAYIIEVRLGGKKVGIIPVAAIKKNVEEASESSAYYEMMRRWAERAVGTSDEEVVLIEKSSVNPNEVLGDSVRYVPGQDPTASRLLSDIMAEIRAFGGNTIRIDQADGKTILTFEYFQGKKNKQTIELEALRMRKVKGLAKDLIQENISLLEGTRAGAEVDATILQVEKALINYNLNQLSRDYYEGRPYAVQMFKDGLIEEDKGAEGIVVGNQKRPKMKVKRSDIPKDNKNDLRDRYANFLKFWIKGLTDSEYVDNFGLRMPTSTLEGGVIDFTRPDTLNLQTVNNVEAIAPKLYLDVTASEVLLGKKGGLSQKQADEENQVYYDQSYEEMVALFQELLGQDFQGFSREQLVMDHGKVTMLGMILMNFNGEGKSSSRTLYHEVAHYVAEFLMSRNDRNQLYSEIAAKMDGVPNWMTDSVQRRLVAERWAEMAERYAADRRNLKGISKFMRRMMDGLLNFFRRLGVYKSVVDQHLYDIYVMKKYRGADGMMMQPLYDSLEDIYGDDLHKAKNYSDPQAVIDYFGDRDSAIKAQHTVTQQMSKYLTIPTLSKRSFKQKGVEFKDLINRVEYNLRSQIMFNTDDEGNVVMGKNGMPEIRTDANGQTLTIKHKGVSVPLFEYRQNYQDEQTTTFVTAPTLFYFEPREGKYIEAPVSDNGVYFLDPKSRGRIRALLRSALKRYEIETQILDEFDEFEVVTAFNPDPELRNQVKDVNDLRLMEIAASMSDEVFLGMVQRNFQTVEAADLFYGKNNRNRFGETHERMIEAQDTVARKETDQISALDRMSAMIRFLINTVPQYAYDGSKWVPTKRFVRHELAQQILQKLPMMHYNPRLGSSIDMMKEAMLKKISELDQLRSQAGKFHDEEWTAINSLYQLFFNDDTGESMSHMTIIDMFQRTLDPREDKTEIYNEYVDLHNRQKEMGIVAQNEPALEFEEFMSDLRNRAKEAYDILAAMSTHFGSIARDNVSKATFYGSGENARTYVNRVENASLGDTKESINRNIDSMMFASDFSIGTHYRNLFGFNEDRKQLSGDNDYDAYTTIDTTDGLGIYYTNKITGNKHKIISLTENGFEVVDINKLQVTDKLQMGTVIRAMIREVYGEQVWLGHADRLAIPRGDNEEAIGWEDFADIVAPVYMSAYIYAANGHYQDKAKENAPYLETFEQILEAKYGKDSRYGKLSQAQIEASRVTEQETEEGRLANKDEGEELVYYPKGFFNEVKTFGQFLVAVRGGSRAAWGKSVDGKRMHLDTVQSMIGYHFDDKGQAMAEAYQEEVSLGLRTEDINSLNYPDPNFGDFVGVNMNPMRTMPGFVAGRTFPNGMARGKVGRKLDQMNERDNWDLQLEMFMQDRNASESNWRNKQQPLFLTNHGDRSRQEMLMMNWRIGGVANPNPLSNGLMIKKTVDGQTTFEVDAQNMMQHVFNMYGTAIKAQARSLNKWVRFYMAKGKQSLKGTMITEEDLISDLDLLSDDPTLGYEKVKRTYAKIGEMLDEDDLFIRGDEQRDANGNVIIYHNDLPIQLFGTDLKMGEDFVVVKQKKGDKKGKVLMGFTSRLFGDVRGTDGGGNYVRFGSPVKFLSAMNRATRMPVEFMNGDTYPTIEQAALESIKRPMKMDAEKAKKYLYGIFKDDLYEANERAKDHGAILYAKQMDTNQSLPKSAKSTLGYKVAGGQYYNPFAAMVMGHAIANTYFMFGFEGTFSNHIDYEFTSDMSGTSAIYSTNANKRFLQHSSTMQLPNYGGHYMIDINTPTLHLAEPTMAAVIETASKDGSIRTRGHSPFDGQGFINPLYRLMLWHSYGGKNGVMDVVGSLKTQSIQENGNYYKHSLVSPSTQSMELMPEERALVEIMLNPTAKPTTDEIIKYESDLDQGGAYEANDSLWQRYLLYEQESYFYRAVDKMNEFIESQGGLRNFLANNQFKFKNGKIDIDGEPRNLTDSEIDSFMKDFDSTMKFETMMFKYDKLKFMLLSAGFESEVIPVEPEINTKADGDWAMDKLLDFYADKRVELGKDEQGNPIAQQVYPYISHAEIDDGAIKQKARTLPIPTTFNYGGSSTLVPLGSLQTPSGKVPTDLFSAYGMHKEEGGGLALGNFVQMRNNMLEGIQLSANRSYDDSIEAPMVQMMSLLIASPHLYGPSKDLGKRMMQKMADIMEVAIQGFEDDLNLYKGKFTDEDNAKTPEEVIIQRFLKEKVKANMSNHDDGSMMSVIVNNDKIHISTSMGTEERMYQYLASWFRKNVVKRKVEAMRLVQASGMLVELYEYTRTDGRKVTMSRNEMKRYAMRNLGMNQADFAEGQLPQGFEKRGLKQTVIRLKEGYELTPAELQLQSKLDSGDFLRYLIENNKAEIEPGEVVIPGAKFAKYGIPKRTTLNELFTINYYDGEGNPMETLLYDLAKGNKRTQLKEAIQNIIKKGLQFVTEEVNGKTRTRVEYTDMMKYGENPYFDILFHDSFKDWLKKNQKVVRQIEKDAKAALIAEAGSTDAFIEKYKNNPEQQRADMSALTNQMLLEAIANDTTESLPDLVNMMTDGLIAVNLTTEEVLGTRTPSGPGSSFFNKVAYIINDNGSTGYVNTIKNEVDGSDQDIDQFTMYYRTDTMKALGYSQEEIDNQFNKWREQGDIQSRVDEQANNLNNELIDLIFEYYKDPKATDLTMSAIGLGSIKEASRGSYEAMFPNGDFAFNLGHTISMRALSYDGKAVGPAANAQKGQTYLMAAYQALGNQGLNANVMPMVYDKKTQKYLSTDHYRNIPRWVEGLVNAATDNPKLMLLGTINVNISNMSAVANAHFANKLLYDFVDNNRSRFDLPEKGSPEEAAMIADPKSEYFDNEGNLKEEISVYLFFKGEAHRRIFKNMKRNASMKEGKRSGSLYKEAYDYYAKLTGNTDQNKKDLENTIKEMGKEMDRITEALGKLLTQDQIAELIQGDETLTSDAMKAIRQLSKKAVKKEYLAISKLLQARLRGDLKAYNDNELTKAVEEQLASTKQQFVDNIASIREEALDKMGVKDTEEAAQLMEQKEEWQQTMSELFKALRNYERLQKNAEEKRRLTDDTFKQEVLLVAKYAFFGDWMDRWIKIVGINQFQITSAYDAYSYDRNLRFMTGMSMQEMASMWKEFKEKGYTSARAFMEDHPSYRKSAEKRAETARELYRHSMAKADYTHMLEPIGEGDARIDYMEDFANLADVPELLLSLPSIMESITAASKVEKYADDIMATRQQQYREILDTILDDTGQDQLNETKYRTYFEEVHKYMTGKYLSQPKLNDQLDTALMEMGQTPGTPLIGTSASGRVPGINAVNDANTFIKQFPIFWEGTLKTKIMEGLENESARKLMQALRVKRKGSYAYLEISNPASMTQHELAILREGYKALPVAAQNLLALYQLVKDGYSYRASAFLSQIVDEKWYIDFSNFIEDTFKDENKLSKADRHFFKMMVLSDTRNGIAPKATQIKVGKNWVQRPPIGANGVVTYYNRQVHFEKTKFGGKEQRALAQVTRTRYVTGTRGKAKTSTENVIVADKIIDAEKATVHYAEHERSGTPLPGLTVGAYFNYIIKGNIDRIIANRFNAEGNEQSIEEITKEVLDVDWMNKNYRSEYRREAYKYKQLDDKMTAEQIKTKVANEYQRWLAGYFKAIYKEDPQAFNQLVSQAEGKVISDAFTFSEIGMSYQLAAMFNQLIDMQKGTDKTFYDFLGDITGIPETMPQSVEEQYWMPMHAGKVGNTYRNAVMMDENNNEHVRLFNPNAREELAELLGWNRKDYTPAISPSDVTAMVMDYWGLVDGGNSVDLIPDGRLQELKEMFKDKIDPNVADFKHKVVEYIGKYGTRHHREDNVDYELENRHAIDLYDKTGNRFSMQRRSAHQFRNGDVVFFNDGSIGVVTNTYDLDKNGNPKAYDYRLVNQLRQPRETRVHKAITTLEDRTARNNSRQAVEAMVRKLSRSMQGTPYRFIGIQEQRDMGVDNNAVSFFHNGTVYINLDRADQATAVHEFAHPYVIALKNDRPELYEALANSVRSDQQLMQWVRRNYPELLTEDEILMEAIPTFIQMRFYAQQYFQQTDAERAAWADYFQWVKSTFTQATLGEANLETKLNELDFSSATLNDFADAIIADLMSESVIPWMSDPQYRHAVPYTMKAKSTSKLKNIKLENIDQLIQRKAMYGEEVEKREQLAYHIDNALASGQPFVGLSGTYNFGDSNPRFKKEGRFDSQLRDKYIQEAIKAETRLMDSVGKKAIDFFETLRKGDVGAVQAAKETLFPGLKKYDEDEQLYEQYLQMVNSMINELNFNPQTDTAMTFKEGIKYLGVSLPTNIKTSEEPIIIIHNVGKVNQAISILNMTTLRLEETGAMDMRPINQAFVEEAELNMSERRRFKSNSLMNTRQDINALRNGVLAMAISKENPKIQIRRVGTVQFTGYEGKPFKKHYKEMQDLVPQIGKFFKPDILREGLERDLYDIVTDAELLDTDRYAFDTLEQLGRYLNSALAQEQTVEGKNTKKLEEALNLLQHVQEDDTQARMPALAKAIKARLDYLRIQVLGNDIDMIANSTEYQDLAYTYMQLTGYNEINTMKVTPITLDEKFIDTADRWHGQVRTWVFDSIDLGLRKSKEELIPFQEQIDTQVKALFKLRPELKGVTDSSHKLFRNLFKTKTVLDHKGNEVEVSLHELHWDKNDEETARLLREGVLKDEEVEFAAWLADQMYEEFVNYIMDVERSSVRVTHEDTEEQMRQRAIQKVNTRYKKGMMPVFIQTGASALSEGNLKKAYDIFMKTASSWYGGNIFDEYKQSEDKTMQKEAFKKLMSPFWSQFNSVENYGSRNRLKLLGLGRNGDQLVLLNPERQNTLSFNLENIGLFSMAASMRARHLKEAVGKVNIALDILRGEQALKGTNVGDIIQQLENYVNRQVYGNLPKTGIMQIGSVAINVDNMLDAGGKLIHMVHLAANGVLGAKNLSSQALKMFTNSVVNAISGNKQFKTDDVARAVGELVANPKKVAALNKMYQIVNITERDLLNHFINNTTRKNVFETEFQMIFHWFGDYYTQLIGAMAQMMEDGTYDAHSLDDNGKVIYDETKDKRFQGEDGEIIKRAIIRQQQKEEYHAPGEDGKMTHAYSQRQENGIKVVVQRYVSELNDTQYKNMMSSFGLARAMMSLKTYMYNVKQNWWKNRRAEVQLGDFEVLEKGGKKDAYWNPEMVEGVLQTWIYLGGFLGKKAKSVLSKDAEPVDFEWDSYRTRNMIHTAATIGTIAGVYFLVDLLTKGFDDDEDKRKKNPEPVFYGKMLWDRILKTGYVASKDQGEINYAQQMLRYIIGGAANEQLSYANPAQIYKEWSRSPNPYFWQVKNTWDAMTMLIGFPYQLYDEEATVRQDMDELLVAMSKTIPYGNNYRTLRNAYVKLSEDVIDETLNANFKPQ